jgi:hypothetical protein
MKRLEPFIGEWTLEALFPGSGPSGSAGRTTFAWRLDGTFLEQRTQVDHPEAPDSIAIVSRNGDGEAYTEHYFDSRGVVRVYAMAFGEDGVWELLRTTPDFTPLNFSQRYRGSFEDGGETIRGAWEKSDDGGSTWELDFELIYRRV